ncbi:MAG: phosphopyruvate hydratase [Spirochaetales bacterium]
MSKYKITNIVARQILDSRGIPTIESEVTLKCGAVGVSKVPSGASTGQYEAHELRDGDKTHYFGKGVLKAVENVNTLIKNALVGKSADEQTEIDNLLIALDGIKNKTNLGANAILSVSIACAHAVANAKHEPIYAYLNSLTRAEYKIPVPMCNILNGGAHASNNIDIQEFMIMPIGAKTFEEGIRWCSEIFNSLKNLLKSAKHSIAVGDEGGFAPDLQNEEEALKLIIEAINRAGYNTETQVKLAIDAAASEWVKDETSYLLPKSERAYTNKEMVAYWVDILNRYPIISLEDPLGENDHEGFKELTSLVGNRVQIVGDDLFVTNIERLSVGIENKEANSILIKLNQIGSLTETLKTIALAKSAGFTTVISHRSGETEDTFIADLAVATGSTQIKTGSLSRSERIAKYNRLLKIESELNDKNYFAGDKAFYQLNK